MAKNIIFFTIRIILKSDYSYLFNLTFRSYFRSIKT